MWKYYLFLAGAILCEIAGTSALKASRGFTVPVWAVLTAVAYGGSFWLLGLTLKGMSLGVAYAIWAGVGTGLTAVAGFVIFKERPDAAALVGMGLIIAGVTVMHLFSKTVSH